MSECLRCGEPVLPDEPQEGGYLLTPERHVPIVQHRACAVRAVIGSVAHLERRCSCYIPGADEGDPPGLSKREAAEAALAVWLAQQEDFDTGMKSS